MEAVLEELEGVTNAEVNLSSKTVIVEGENLDDDLMASAIEEAGYELVEIK